MARKVAIHSQGIAQKYGISTQKIRELPYSSLYVLVGKSTLYCYT